MTFLGVLHPYQEEAVDRFINRRSLLIAYGCGTGKTVMAIAAAEKLMNLGEVRQVLILCPASLKYQWAEKIRQFTDSPLLIVDGTKVQRSNIYEFARTTDIRYVICSYESVLYDYDEMLCVNPDMVICDEVSAIKSFKAKKSKRVKKMLKSRYRMG